MFAVRNNPIKWLFFLNNCSKIHSNKYLSILECIVQWKKKKGQKMEWLIDKYIIVSINIL